MSIIHGFDQSYAQGASKTSTISWPNVDAIDISSNEAIFENHVDNLEEMLSEAALAGSKCDGSGVFTSDGDGVDMMSYLQNVCSVFSEQPDQVATFSQSFFSTVDKVVDESFSHVMAAEDAVFCKVAQFISLIEPLLMTSQTCTSCWKELVRHVFVGSPVSLCKTAVDVHHSGLVRTMLATNGSKMKITTMLVFSLVASYLKTGNLLKTFVTSDSLYMSLLNAYSVKYVEAQGQSVVRNPIEVIYTVMKGALGLRVSLRDFEEACQYARQLSSTLPLIDRLVGLLIFLMRKVAQYINDIVVSPPNEIAEWLSEVDNYVQRFSMSENGSVITLKKKLSKFQTERIRLYRLYRQGIKYKHQYEVVLGDRTAQTILTKVVVQLNKIERVFQENIGSYVGTEGKVCPFVIFVHGLPGVGKTILVDHLMRDVYGVLKEMDYNPAVDKYSFNSLSKFFDTYNYQRVFEVQDFLQVLDKEVQMNEIINVMKMADESAYPMNVAECSAKGTLYFASEFIYISSNVDLSQRTTQISTIIESSEALLRRLDINCELKRQNLSEGGFDRDSLFFIVDGKQLCYNDFVILVCEKFRHKLAKSNIMTNLEMSQDKERVFDLQKRLSSTARVSCEECLHEATPCSSCIRMVATPKLQYRIDSELVTERVFLSKLSLSITCTVSNCPTCRLMTLRHVGSLSGHWVVYRGDHQGMKKGGEHHLCDEVCDRIAHERSHIVMAQSAVCLPGTSFSDCSSPPLETVEDSFDCSVHPLYNKFARQVLPIDFNADIDSLFSRTGRQLRVNLIGTYTAPDGQVVVVTTPHIFMRTLYFEIIGNRIVSISVRTSYWLPLKTMLRQLVSFLSQCFSRACQWAKNCKQSLVVGLCSLVSVTAANRYMMSYLSANILEIARKVFMACCVAGTVLWAWTLYCKTKAPALVEPSGQAIANTSGGETVVKSGRRFEVSGPRHGMKVIKAQANTQQLAQLKNHLRNVVGRVVTGRCSMHCIMLGKKKILIPLHAFVDLSSWMKVVLPGGIGFTFSLSEVDHIVCEDNHCIIIDFESLPEAKHYRMFPDLNRLVVLEQQLASCSYGFLFCQELVEGRICEMQKTVNHIRVTSDPIHIRDATRLIQANDCIEYEAITIAGDCGSVLVSEVQGMWKVLGFHVAGTGVFGYSGYLTKEWLTSVCDVFSASFPESQGFSPEVFHPTPIEELSDDETLMFMPRTSKLRNTYFPTEGLTMPAKLKGKFDLDGQVVTPLEKSLYKSLRPLCVPCPARFEKALSYMKDKYKSGKLVIYSMEEAIFGDTDDVWNKSMDANSSVGYPWNLHFTRAQLFDKVSGFVHPQLRSSIDEFLEQSKLVEPEFFVVDMLKDERLPVAKVDKGETRVFSILPLHVNIVLKMLFGAFQNSVVGAHRVKSVKVGLAVKHEDVVALARYLKLHDKNREFLCGDIKASDRVIPYEVFSLLVEMVNGLYDDDFQVHRQNIAKKLFQPVHAGANYRYVQRQGMPSGCYLTAVFNSLAYEVLLRQCFYDLNFMLGLPTFAVYGDDHVVSCNKGVVCPTKVVQWFSEIGIDYVAADKTSVVSMCDWKKVSFLKRHFAYVGTILVMRRDIKDLREALGWYHATAVTRSWSALRLHREMFGIFLMEVSLYGREVFNMQLQGYQPILDALRMETTLIGDMQWETYFQLYVSQDMESGFDSTYIQNELWWDSAALVQVPAQGNDAQEVSGLNSDTASMHQNPTTIDDNLVAIETNVTPLTVTQTVELPPLDSCFEWDASYCKQLERPYVMGQFSLPTTNASNVPFKRFVTTSAFVNKTYLYSRMNQALYFRCGVEVEIKVLSTKFHYGQLMVLFRPGYFLNQTRVLLTDTQRLKCSYVSAYDHISVASMCPHAIISLTGQTSTVLKLPWHFPLNYVPFDVEKEWAYDLGCLDIYMLTSAYPTDIDRPEIVVIGHLTDVRLFGYSQRPFLQVDVPFEVQLDFNYFGNLIVEKNKDHEAVKVVTAQGLPVEAPQLGVVSAVAQTVVVGAQWVGRIATFFSTIAQALGWSHPRDFTGPQIVAYNLMPLANSVGKNPAVTLGFKCDDQLKTLWENPSELTFDGLASIYTYIQTLVFTTKNEYKIFPLGPRLMYTTDLETLTGGKRKLRLCTPAAALSLLYCSARCDCLVKLCFSISAMAAVRVRISFERYNPQFQYNGNQEPVESFLDPTVVLDVVGDAQYEWRLPFMSPNYMSTETVFWYVRVELLTPIVVPDAHSMKPLVVSCWVAYPSLQIMHESTQHLVESGNKLPGTYITRNRTNMTTEVEFYVYRKGGPQDGAIIGMPRSGRRPGTWYHEGNETWESEKDVHMMAVQAQSLMSVPLAGDKKVETQYGPSNLMTSLYHLLKRPSAIFLLKEIQLITGFPFVDSTHEYSTHECYQQQFSLLCFWKQCFKYHRGSVTFVGGFGDRPIVSNVTELLGQNEHQITLKGFGNNIFSPGGWLASDVKTWDVPYKSALPYDTFLSFIIEPHKVSIVKYHQERILHVGKAPHIVEDPVQPVLREKLEPTVAFTPPLTSGFIINAGYGATKPMKWYSFGAGDDFELTSFIGIPLFDLTLNPL